MVYRDELNVKWLQCNAFALGDNVEVLGREAMLSKLRFNQRQGKSGAIDGDV